MELPKKISGEKIAFAAQQLHTKIRCQCVVGGLGEEERTKIRKKTKEKKGKKRKINLIAAKSGLVGMKGYLETYNPMKYFLPYLSHF